MTKNGKSKSRNAPSSQGNHRPSAASHGSSKSVLGLRDNAQHAGFAPKRSHQELASTVMTCEECDYHGALRDGLVQHPIVNHNIENSMRKTRFVSQYDLTMAVPANSTYSVAIMSASTVSIGDHPKAFITENIANANAVGGTAVPGPAATGIYKSGAMVWGNNSNPDRVALDTTGFVGGFGFTQDPVNPCPFETTTTREPQDFRWQLVQIRVKSINVSKGLDRGGAAYVMQPSNRYDVGDVAANIASVGSFMNRGVFKSYDEMEIRGPKNSDGWVSLDVRPALQAYYTNDAIAVQTSSLGNAAAFFAFSNTTSVANSVTLLVELVWSLSGARVRGISIPHVIPASVSDRAAEASEAMRTANRIPSDQSPKESIAGALALNQSPALQAHIAGPAGPVVSRSKVEVSKAHPVVDAMVKLAGRHLKHLAEAGVSGLVHHAARAVGVLASI